MALTKCAASLAASVAPNCSALPIAGFEDSGLLFNADEVTYTRDSTNPRKITAITLADGATPFHIYNPEVTPFGGSTSELKTDSAFPTFTKTIKFNVPSVGADASLKILEPLMKNRTGFVILLRSKNHVADGGFILIGTENGAIATKGSRDFTDQKKNGMFAVELAEEGAFYETVTLYGSTYEAAKETYDTLDALVTL